MLNPRRTGMIEQPPHHPGQQAVKDEGAASLLGIFSPSLPAVAGLTLAPQQR